MINREESSLVTPRGSCCDEDIITSDQFLESGNGNMNISKFPVTNYFVTKGLDEET
jgi:hypothetical protein